MEVEQSEEAEEAAQVEEAEEAEEAVGAGEMEQGSEPPACGAPGAAGSRQRPSSRRRYCSCGGDTQLVRIATGCTRGDCPVRTAGPRGREESSARRAHAARAGGAGMGPAHRGLRDAVLEVLQPVWKQRRRQHAPARAARG